MRLSTLDLEALSNLLPEDTGVVDAVLWISAGEFSSSDVEHGPRLQVVLGRGLTVEGIANSVSVTLTNPPRMLGTLPSVVATQVTAFVERNRDALLRH
jgi:hypothetical protein